MIAFLQAFLQCVYPNSPTVPSLINHCLEYNPLIFFLCVLMFHSMYFHIPKFFQLITESIFVFLPNLHNNSVRLFDNLRHLDILDSDYSTGSTSSNCSTRVVKLIKSVFKVSTSFSN